MPIFIVIPAYNEAKRIGKVLSGLQKTNLPVVVIDDGSTDNLIVKIKKAKSQFKIKNLTIIEHKINLGKGAAMKTGALAAFSMGAEAVIFMDADGQHTVDDLSKFTEALNSVKYDVVFGSRNLGLGVPLERYLGNKLASVLINLLFGIYVSDLVCGYRALTKKAFEKINWESTGYGVETEMAVRTAQLNLKHCEVDVATVYYDKFKGVSILDAIGIFFDVVRWRISK